MGIVGHVDDGGILVSHAITMVEQKGCADEAKGKGKTAKGTCNRKNGKGRGVINANEGECERDYGQCNWDLYTGDWNCGKGGGAAAPTILATCLFQTESETPGDDIKATKQKPVEDSTQEIEWMVAARHA